MDINQMAAQLKHQADTIVALCEDIKPDAARWKPAPDSWSLLEVVNHLVDEEVLDFRGHLEHILHTPKLPWPEIDPMGWVTSKAYNQRAWFDSINNFRIERDKSITWLLSLTEINWDAAVHMSWGSLSAGDIAASWLAHDLLHLRQIIELHYQLTAQQSEPFSVKYAGQW